MEFNKLQAVFDKYRLYQDRNLVRMICASVIANQLEGKSSKPFWVVFVAPPGGGKSDIVATLTGVTKNEKKLFEEISDLTSASFASGMNSLEGETSLLKRLENNHGALLLFKDFTTVLSKNKDDMAMIMAYLREIYDGKFEKKFGNGKNVKWEGKVGLIACSTTVIYNKLQDISVMGDRLILYQIEQPDRIAVQKKIFENEDNGTDGSVEMADAMQEYMKKVFSFLKRNSIDEKIPIETREEFLEIADFVTLARSGVVWNWRHDRIVYVPEPEMPTRVLRQLIALADALRVINAVDNKKFNLSKNDLKIIVKVALDSISSPRRNLLIIIASYSNGITMTALASEFGMPYETTKDHIDELLAIKLVEKRTDTAFGKDRFFITEKYIPIIFKYEEIKEVKEINEDDDDDISEFEKAVSEYTNKK